MEVNEEDSNYFRIVYLNQKYKSSNIYKKRLIQKRSNNDKGAEI